MTDPLVADGAASVGRTLSRSQARFLRYWALNITLARRRGQPGFPGFSYDEAEWARLDQLSTGVTAGGFFLWIGMVVLTYLVVAILVVVGVIGTAVMTVWKSGNVPESQVFAAIAILCGLMIGIAMPLSISFGGLVADPLWRNRPELSPTDRALYAKISGQFRRMALVLAVVVFLAAASWAAFLK